MSETEQTPVDVLEHYGVLGMKWGKTRAKADAHQVRAARANIRTKTAQLDQQAVKMRKGSESDRAAAAKKYGTMKTALLKNPDRVTAARLTRGEKYLAVALGLTGLGTPFTVGAIGATSARSRRIERKQDLGKYDKK